MSDDSSKRIVPRFEFRTFSQEFGTIAEKLRNNQFSKESDEVRDLYCLSLDNTINNVKIRENTLGVKTLLRKEQELELWCPVESIDFPAEAALAGSAVCHYLSVPTGDVYTGIMPAGDFADQVLRSHSGIWLADVIKNRSSFTINGCKAEITDVLVNGASIMSMSIESEDLTDVLRAREMLGLAGYQNINYIRAIGTIMGLLVPSLSRWPMSGGYWYG